MEQSNGDYNKAVDFLREKGLATAAKRADRTASDGTLELYSHGGGRVGVMVEVNSETDFVGRSENFRKFAHEIALQIAAAAPRYVKEEEIPEAVLERERQVANRQSQRRRQTRSDHSKDRRRIPGEIQERNRIAASGKYSRRQHHSPIHAERSSGQFGRKYPDPALRPAGNWAKVSKINPFKNQPQGWFFVKIEAEAKHGKPEIPSDTSEIGG